MTMRGIRNCRNGNENKKKMQDSEMKIMTTQKRGSSNPRKFPLVSCFA